MSKLPLVQQTAPERIWLAVADDAYYAEQPFPDGAEEVCWSSDAPLEVCVPYVRADLANPAPPTSDPMPQTFFSYNDGSGRIRDWRTPAGESGADVRAVAWVPGFLPSDVGLATARRIRQAVNDALTPTAEPRSAAQEVVIEAVGRIVADDEQGRRVEDAARWRWVVDENNWESDAWRVLISLDVTPEEMTAAVDAARLRGGSHD